ncbi:MAG: transposase [Coprococcus sp.]
MGIRNFCILCYTDAPLKHFLNSQETGSILEQHPASFRVLHTWGQTLNFHPHIHCIVSGGGLSVDQKLRRCGEKFFIPVRVMAKVFRGKFLCYLQKYYVTGKLVFSSSCAELRNSYSWNEFRDSLYKMDWCPYIKETFNGFGNAIEYLGALHSSNCHYEYTYSICNMIHTFPLRLVITNPAKPKQ